tara:strand:- start:2795 stop:3265 length:471 start_codon:yes stop_codon:yes gene_type:complete
MGVISTAVAVMAPLEGETASGTLQFFQSPDGVTLRGVFTGLSPNSEHALSVYEYGDLSAISKHSIGKRYNPERTDHAIPPNSDRPPGRFGNITTNEYGEALFELFDQTITIAGIKYPVLGRAVAIHELEDTQQVPSGGQVIAIGVIGIAKSTSNND